jgi:hypothetical protein
VRNFAKILVPRCNDAVALISGHQQMVRHLHGALGQDRRRQSGGCLFPDSTGSPGEKCLSTYLSYYLPMYRIHIVYVHMLLEMYNLAFKLTNKEDFFLQKALKMKIFKNVKAH